MVFLYLAKEILLSFRCVTHLCVRKSCRQLGDSRPKNKAYKSATQPAMPILPLPGSNILDIKNQYFVELLFILWKKKEFIYYFPHFFVNHPVETELCNLPEST